eukprot:scpid29616/ scgid10043/ Receptor-type tyrosine-protein phosphatase C; Leukocyte common antigen; T200
MVSDEAHELWSRLEDLEFSLRKTCPSNVGKENAPLNRYKDILPYDNCRVVLSPAVGGSDYVNASLVRARTDGMPDAIASQAPHNDSAFAGFWACVWQNGVTAIVVLSNMMENGRVKVHRYFPDTVGQSVEHGATVITLVAKEANGDVITRRMSLACQNAVRDVVHVQFTGWPDRKVPESPSVLLSLIRLVRGTLHRQRVSPPPGSSVRPSPLLVHCSAGVGRTGTFLALMEMNIMLERNPAAGVDIMAVISHLRRCRTRMVQTNVQLDFLLEALAHLRSFGTSAGRAAGASGAAKGVGASNSQHAMQLSNTELQQRRANMSRTSDGAGKRGPVPAATPASSMSNAYAKPSTNGEDLFGSDPFGDSFVQLGSSAAPSQANAGGKWSAATALSSASTATAAAAASEQAHRNRSSPWDTPGVSGLRPQARASAQPGASSTSAFAASDFASPPSSLTATSAAADQSESLIALCGSRSHSMTAAPGLGGFLPTIPSATMTLGGGGPVASLASDTTLFSSTNQSTSSADPFAPQQQQPLQQTFSHSNFSSRGSNPAARDLFDAAPFSSMPAPVQQEQQQQQPLSSGFPAPSTQTSMPSAFSSNPSQSMGMGTNAFASSSHFPAGQQHSVFGSAAQPALSNPALSSPYAQSNSQQSGHLPQTSAAYSQAGSAPNSTGSMPFPSVQGAANTGFPAVSQHHMQPQQAQQFPTFQQPLQPEQSGSFLPSIAVATSSPAFFQQQGMSGCPASGGASASASLSATGLPSMQASGMASPQFAHGVAGSAAAAAPAAAAGGHFPSSQRTPQTANLFSSIGTDPFSSAGNSPMYQQQQHLSYRAPLQGNTGFSNDRQGGGGSGWQAAGQTSTNFPAASTGNPFGGVSPAASAANANPFSMGTGQASPHSGIMAASAFPTPGHQQQQHYQQQQQQPSQWPGQSPNPQDSLNPFAMHSMSGAGAAAALSPSPAGPVANGYGGGGGSMTLGGAAQTVAAAGAFQTRRQRQQQRRFA